MTSLPYSVVSVQLHPLNIPVLSRKPDPRSGHLHGGHSGQVIIQHDRITVQPAPGDPSAALKPAFLRFHQRPFHDRRQGVQVHGIRVFARRGSWMLYSQQVRFIKLIAFFNIIRSSKEEFNRSIRHLVVTTKGGIQSISHPTSARHATV